MKKLNFKKTLVLTFGAVIAFSALEIPVSYASDGGFVCSNQMVAGRWLFASDVGNLPGIDTDITAIGTMNLSSEGEVSGKFDVTVSNTFFGPDNTYTGTFSINPDCTGTLQFVTSSGSSRTDSIIVVSRTEIIGMSQDIYNIWTYQVRRAPGSN